MTHPSPRLLASLSAVAAAVGFLACGGGNGDGNPCTCPNGCDATGKCLTAPDGGTPLTCDMSLKPVGTPVAAGSAVVIPLGQHAVGAVVPFTVPAGTASVTVIEQVVSGAPDAISLTSGGETRSVDNTAVPVKLAAPGGVTVYDDLVSVNDLTADQIEALLGFYASNSPATGTLTVPNTARGLTQFASGLPAGTWSVTVSDFAYECATHFGNCTGSRAGVYDVTVVTKPLSSGAIQGAGALDVDFYFLATTAGGVALSEATAAADVDLQRMVSTLGTIFAQQGITVQHVGFHDLPNAARDYPNGNVDINSSGACAPLGQLLRNGADGNRLNIFLATNFTYEGLPAGQVVAGIDGTIPGPATVGGTVASGAAVSVANLRKGSGLARCQGGPSYTGATACGADTVAYTIAHEAGHFLGLYHVTESTGDLFDPLSDTARCTCTSCAPSASVSQCATGAVDLMTSDCLGARSGCGGGENLMFWIIDAGAQGALTAQQGAVMRANALVH